jgi:hypothetical protein
MAGYCDLIKMATYYGKSFLVVRAAMRFTICRLQTMVVSLLRDILLYQATIPIYML